MRGHAVRLMLGVGLTGLAGCEQPNHQARIERREDNLRRTLNMFDDLESSHSEKLRRTVAMLKDQNDHDVANSRENVEEVDQDIRDEFDHSRKREPAFRKRIQELMQGDPGAIDRTLPWILY